MLKDVWGRGCTVFRNGAFGEVNMDMSAIKEAVLREVFGHEDLCKRICD